MTQENGFDIANFVPSKSGTQERLSLEDLAK